MRPFTLLCFALLTARLASGQPAPQSPLLSSTQDFEGKPIAEIQFDPPEQPYPRDVLDKILPMKTGAPFREDDIHAAIQALFSTGRFADIAVDARFDDSHHGVILRFITKNAYFIGRVSFEGVQDPPASGQIGSTAKLVLGQPYNDSDRQSAAESIETLMRQNGFYNAKVDSSVEYAGATEEANVAFHLNLGKRAHYEEPAITGTPKRSTKDIVKSTHWLRLFGLLGWHQVTETRTLSGVDGVRSYYQQKDLLLARVSLRSLEYEPRTNTVKPTLQVAAGPEIAVQVRGVSIRKSKLRQLVPVYQERTVDTDLLVEGQHNLATYLQSEGYFEADVAYSIANESGRRTIVFQVTRGVRRRLKVLEIKGNKYFRVNTIRERMVTQPVSFPRYPYGRYSLGILNGDLQAIRDLYRLNGFRNAKIDYQVVDAYLGHSEQLKLVIQIDEGAQSFVADVSIAGISDADQKYLESRMISSKGQPYSEVNVAADRDLMLNYFYDQGYTDATFDYYVEPAGIESRVKLLFKINPGRKKYVRAVLVSGLFTTKPKLVNDRMELHSGDPLSLAKETDTQRRLYDLGIFARVDTAIQNPDGDEDRKYVLYQIDEARRYSFTFGIGAQLGRIGGGVTSFDAPAGTTGFAPRGSFGVSRLNFLGLGQTLSLNTTISTLEQRATLTYFVPQIAGDKRFNLTLTALYDNSNDIRTFTSHRREVSGVLGQKLNRVFTIQYRGVFRYVTESNLKIEPLLVPILAQPDRTGLIGISLIQDRRDDPADAHSGIYTTVDVAYATKYLGSQTPFGRALIRNSTYHRIGRDLVFARSTQFGIISTPPGGAEDIPLPERFFSGGSNSLRAFPDNQAGPRDAGPGHLVTGFPLGGNALFINNLELRFPLFGENIGGVIFHDLGNVYTDIQGFSLRFRQNGLSDFNYAVQGFGFGIRYRTPIGPIRLDLSLSPDAPRFFGFKGTEDQLIEGTGIQTVQKINGFQFHFSLGQAF